MSEIDIGTSAQFIGTLLGAACGDALGAAAEFMPLHKVRERFGVLRDFQPYPKHKAGEYTDDTVLMLSLAESICECDGVVDADHCAKSAVKWWRKTFPRGYGPNTLKAMKLLEAGADYRTTAGNMPSNGAAMRIAPVGLIPVIQEQIKEVHDACRWSHSHPRAEFAAFLHATRIGFLVSGREPSENAIQDYLGMSDEQIIKAMITPNQFGDNFAIDGEQAVDLALWCFASHRNNPEQAVIRAVNLGGDADTIGCLVGSLCGAAYGTEWIPKRWFLGLENNGDYGRDAIINLGTRLFVTANEMQKTEEQVA